MKFVPMSPMLLVEQAPAEKKESGGLFIVDDGKLNYAKGKVIGCDDNVYLGKVVAYPVETARALGLGFPKEYVLINLENIHGVIEEGD